MQDEDMSVLQTQLMKWAEDLEKLNQISDENDKTPSKALRKFIITIEYVIREVIGFEKNYNFKFLKSQQVVEKIKSLVKTVVIILEEYAKSVEVSYKKYTILTYLYKIPSKLFVIMYQYLKGILYYSEYIYLYIFSIYTYLNTYI